MKNSGKQSFVSEVLIDKDCPMCQQFGRKLGAHGFNVTSREAALDGSIEVRLNDGTSKLGYFGILEIWRARGILPGWVIATLQHPISAMPGKFFYRLIANNRKFISRWIS